MRFSSTTALPKSPYVPRRSGSTSAIWIVDSLISGSPGIQVAERGVVGDDLDRPLWHLVDGLQRVGHDRVLDLGVGQADGEIGRALAGRDDRAALQALERDVPEPRKIAAVGLVGVDHQDGRVVGLLDDREGLAPARRV